MGGLCFGTYAKSLQKAKREPNGNKDVTELLLGLITDNEDITNQRGGLFIVTDKMASDLLSFKINMYQKIREASAHQPIVDAAHDYFEDVIKPEIIPDLTADLIKDLSEIITSDGSIPEQTKANFLALAAPDMLSDFLSKVFLYALKKPNKATTSLVEMETSVELAPLPPMQLNIVPAESDLRLLMETRSLCPQCGKTLAGEKNGSGLPKYRITDIIPLIQTAEKKAELFGLITGEGINNKIALCLDCANRYIANPTREECIELISKKSSLSRNYTALETLDKMYLEEQIEAVLRQISSATKEMLKDTLSYDALRVKDKIDGNNVPLISLTEGLVVQYYKFIKTVFARIEREGLLSFEDLASEVHIVYKKLSANGLTQDEIFERLVEWFQNRGKTQSRPACQIIVAFFVQNCEVFHALAQ